MTCIATYNLQIVVDDPMPYRELTPLAMADQRVLSNLPAMLESVEEDLTLLLPPGYSAVIKEWSDE